MSKYYKNIIYSGITLGTAQLGMHYGVANRSGMPNKEESFRILDCAVQNGIRTFDTAKAYGESEEILGEYFKGSSEVTIITKFTVSLDASATKEELYQHIVEQVEISMQRLKLDRLPVLMVHHASDLSKFGSKLVSACNTLIQNGYVSSLGVSFGADPIRLTKHYWSIANNPIFEVVQVPINALDHRLVQSRLIKDMMESGKTIFARSIFLQGLLLMEPMSVPSKLSISIPYLKKLRLIANEEGLSINQLAVSFVKHTLGIDSLVIGAESKRQLLDNIKLYDVPQLSKRALDELTDLQAEIPELIISPQLWNK